MIKKLDIGQKIALGIIGIAIVASAIFQALAYFSPQTITSFGSRGFGGTGFVSTDNSSTATLAGDAVFTGTGEDVSRFSSIFVNYDASVNAAPSGLSMQFSSDGTNWDQQFIGDLGAEDEQVHRLTVIAKFFRVVYTNGTTTQSSFRLQTIYHTDNSNNPLSRTGQPQDSVDNVLVRLSTDIDLDFARKHIEGGRAFFFFGNNDAVGTSFEDVWPGSTDINWLLIATTVEVFSSDAADDIAGLGTRSVEIHGLDESGNDQDEVINLDGTTHVFSTKKYIRLNKAHNEKVGTYGGSHQGDIRFESKCDSCTGLLLSVMTGEEGNVDTSVQYGRGEAGNGFWSVPLGKVMYITRLEVLPNVGTNKTMDIFLYEREGLLNTTTASFDTRRVIWHADEFDDPIPKEFKSHIKIKALTDLFFRAKGSATSKISVSLDFYLLDEDASGA